MIPDGNSEQMKLDKLKIFEEAIQKTTIDFMFKEEKEIRTSKQ